MTLPTDPPKVDANDCRTGPSIAYWNDRATQMAKEQGDWDVVDVGAYTRPVQEDVLLFDGWHCTSPLPLPPHSETY
jgi:hypothetical protein